MTVMLLLIVIGLALPLAGYAMLYWLLAEAGEERRPPTPRALIVQCWDAMVWSNVSRWWERPLRLTYRRDKRGRFRKID
jgi:hypothetical protein